MNIFEAIREDHDEQRRLCAELLRTQGDSTKRRQVFEVLVDKLNLHAIAEERHFYVPLIKDDMTQEHARHGVAEHHDIDELIETLNQTEMDSPAWLVHAKKLCEKVEHHLKDEEQVFFQLAGKVFTEDQKHSLAQRYRKAMKDG